MSKTDFFQKLKKADQNKINSLVPAELQKGKTLFRRIDGKNSVSYFQLKKGIEIGSDANIKVEKCQDLETEKQNLAKNIFSTYSAADKKQANNETTEADAPGEDVNTDK